MCISGQRDERRSEFGNACPTCGSCEVSATPHPTPQRERPEARERQRGTQQPPRRERRCRRSGVNWDTVYRLTIRESSNTTSTGRGVIESATESTKGTAGFGAIGGCKTVQRSAGWTVIAATARSSRPTRCNHQQQKDGTRRKRAHTQHHILTTQSQCHVALCLPIGPPSKPLRGWTGRNLHRQMPQREVSGNCANVHRPQQCVFSVRAS